MRTNIPEKKIEYITLGLILLLCIGVAFFFSEDTDKFIFMILYAAAFCINFAVFLWMLTFVFSRSLMFSFRKFSFGLVFSGVLMGYFFLKYPSFSKLLVLHNFWASLVVYLGLRVVSFFNRK